MKKLVSLLLSIMLTISMTTNMAFAGNRVDSTVEEAVMYNSDTWRTTEFARALWTGSMSNVAFPGYIGFPATYPL